MKRDRKPRATTSERGGTGMIATNGDPKDDRKGKLRS
jgi:hypothetical protein